MWMLAAALIAAPAAGPVQTRAEQAQATVRIVRPAIIDFDAGRILAGDSPAQARATQLRLADGSHRPVKLLEFQ